MAPILLDDEFYAMYPALSHPCDDKTEYELHVEELLKFCATAHIYPENPYSDIPF